LEIVFPSHSFQFSCPGSGGSAQATQFSL
jgi:hypothetical protein